MPPNFPGQALPPLQGQTLPGTYANINSMQNVGVPTQGILRNLNDNTSHNFANSSSSVLINGGSPDISNGNGNGNGTGNGR